MSIKTKKTPDLEHLFICKTKLVRQVDYRRNHLLLDLYLTRSKLEVSGFAFVNGQVMDLENKEKGHYQDMRITIFSATIRN